MKRHPANPILEPGLDEWESFACFNGNVVKVGDIYHMFYRAISGERSFEGKKLRISSVGHVESRDGIHFGDRKLVVRPAKTWDRFGCEDPRVTYIDGKYYVFYTAIGLYPHAPDGIRTAVAVSEDLEDFSFRKLVTPFNAKAMCLFPEKIGGKYVGILTVDTDRPPAKVAVACFDTIEQIWDRDWWQTWYMNVEDHKIRLMRISSDQVEIGAPPIKLKEGWLLLYSHIRDYYTNNRFFGVEAVLLDHEDPRKVISRTFDPLLAPDAPYELHGHVPDVVFPSGGIHKGKDIYLYYGGADTVCCVASMPKKDLLKTLQKTKYPLPEVKRHYDNPIITPIWRNTWEQMAVLNPAAFEHDGVIHIVYRAQDNTGESMLGHAMTEDGLRIVEREKIPIYSPRKEFEVRKHQTGNSGCEDPRITVMGDVLHMFYTAYNGVDAPRVALTQIALKDFVAKKWDRWAEPRLISPPGVMDKNACIFPRKVGGKYVLLHRLHNKICFDFVDGLDRFDGKSVWLETKAEISYRPGMWDGVKIGITAPPIETKDGWLLLYHGICASDHVYRVGAMLLDLDEPQKVLSRTPIPILEPIESFERKGVVDNVVFPCGVVLRDGTLYIYYGGADTVICVATVGLDDLLKYLKNFQ